MLVLRRRAGESIVIGDCIEIEVLDVNSQAVKIGIRAPRQTPILRKELYLTQSQNRAAALGGDLESVANSLKLSLNDSSSPHSQR